MGKMTILIAEDDKVSYEYLYEILHGKNININFAPTGKEAVELCKQNPDICLVLMDIKMPVMDGTEAMLAIKAFRPRLPIIAQTAYALNEERDSILESGFDGYLAKPIPKENLLNIIENHTDIKFI